MPVVKMSPQSVLVPSAGTRTLAWFVAAAVFNWSIQFCFKFAAFAFQVFEWASAGVTISLKMIAAGAVVAFDEYLFAGAFGAPIMFLVVGGFFEYAYRSPTDDDRDLLGFLRGARRIATVLIAICLTNMAGYGLAAFSEAGQDFRSIQTGYLFCLFTLLAHLGAAVWSFALAGRTLERARLATPEAGGN